MENLLLHSTGLNRIRPQPEPGTSESGFFTCGIFGDQTPGQLMKLRSISVCNKAHLWGKTHSDWLGLTAKWVGQCTYCGMQCSVFVRHNVTHLIQKVQSSLTKSTWKNIKTLGRMFYGQMSHTYNFLDDMDMGLIMPGENQTPHSTVRTLHPR